MANETAYMAAKMYHNTLEDAKIAIDMFASNVLEAPDADLAAHILKISTLSGVSGIDRHSDISEILRLYRLAALQRAEWQERLKEPS